MDPIRFELTTEQFAALGGHIPGPRNPLSPLPAGEAAVPEMDQQLLQLGLLDPNGQVKEPFAGWLSALAKTDVMLDLSWTDAAGEPTGFSLYSLQTADSPNPWAPTWMGETGSGGVVLRSPFTRQDLEMELQPVLATGDPSAPKMDIGLTAPQALVLSALLDLQNPKNGVDAPWVLAFLQGTGSPAGRNRYFSVPLLSLLPPMGWNLENVGHVLNSLVRLGVCSRPNPDVYSLLEPWQKILDGFTDVGKVFWLTLRRSGGESDELSETEAEHLGFCSGGTNLVFSWMNGNFRLKTYSQAELVEMVAKEIFPTILPPVQSPVTPAVRMAPAPGKKKKVSAGLVAGLVGVLLIACVMLVVGVVLLLV